MSFGLVRTNISSALSLLPLVVPLPALLCPFLPSLPLPMVRADTPLSRAGSLAWLLTALLLTLRALPDAVEGRRATPAPRWIALPGGGGVREHD